MGSKQRSTGPRANVLLILMQWDPWARAGLELRSLVSDLTATAQFETRF